MSGSSSEYEGNRRILDRIDSAVKSAAEKLHTGEVGNTRDAVAVAVEELLADPAFATSLRVVVRGRVAGVLAQLQAADAKAALSPDEQLLQQSWSVLDLQVRTRKGLVRLGISSLGELVQKKENDFAVLKNFGTGSLQNLKDELAKLGLHLADE